MRINPKTYGGHPGMSINERNEILSEKRKGMDFMYEMVEASLPAETKNQEDAEETKDTDQDHQEVRSNADILREVYEEFSSMDLDEVEESNQPINQPINHCQSTYQRNKYQPINQ